MNGLTEVVRPSGVDLSAAPAPATPSPGGLTPLPRRVPQVPPPPFGVAISPGGESLFEPPKRKPRERTREPAPVEPPQDAAPRWAPHPPVVSAADRVTTWDQPAAPAAPPSTGLPPIGPLASGPGPSGPLPGGPVLSGPGPGGPFRNGPGPAGLPPVGPAAGPSGPGLPSTGVPSSGSRSSGPASIGPPAAGPASIDPPAAGTAPVRSADRLANGPAATGLPSTGVPSRELPAFGSPGGEASRDVPRWEPGGEASPDLPRRDPAVGSFGAKASRDVPGPQSAAGSSPAPPRADGSLWEPRGHRPVPPLPAASGTGSLPIGRRPVPPLPGVSGDLRAAPPGPATPPSSTTPPAPAAPPVAEPRASALWTRPPTTDHPAPDAPRPAGHSRVDADRLTDAGRGDDHSGVDADRPGGSPRGSDRAARPGARRISPEPPGPAPRDDRTGTDGTGPGAAAAGAATDRPAGDRGLTDWSTPSGTHHSKPADLPSRTRRPDGDEPTDDDRADHRADHRVDGRVDGRADHRADGRADHRGRGAPADRDAAGTGSGRGHAGIEDRLADEWAIDDRLDGDRFGHRGDRGIDGRPSGGRTGGTARSGSRPDPDLRDRSGTGPGPAAGTGPGPAAAAHRDDRARDDLLTPHLRGGDAGGTGDDPAREGPSTSRSRDRDAGGTGDDPAAAGPPRHREPDRFRDGARSDLPYNGDRFQGRATDGVAGTYQEDPTEVIGPFDIGSWTLQSQEGGSALDRRRNRPESRSEPRLRGGATRERPPRDPRPVGRSRGDDPEPVGASGGGGGGTRPPKSSGGGENDGEPPATGDRVRTVLRGLGQLLLTLGLVLLLLAAYEVWFTDVVNDRTQSRLKNELEQEWQTGDDPVVAAQEPVKPGTKVRSIPLGDGFALIYIPDFGPDYVYTVVEGTDTSQLNAGPGHYVDTPLPGAVGNVAIAGHRVGKGSPFLNLDKLRANSAIVIRTKTYWYTYRVLGETRTGDPTKVGPAGLAGLRIVDPSNVGVLHPVPNKPQVKPTRRLLTLTTCHPKFSARERLVIHAQLEGAPRPTSTGLPPALAGDRPGG